MTRAEAVEILTAYRKNAESIYRVNEDTGTVEGHTVAFDMAIEALEQEPIIRCEDCKHHGTSNCPMWGDDTTEDYMWCCDGERRENNEK